MSVFSEQLAADMSEIIELGEFTETHTIDYMKTTYSAVSIIFEKERENERTRKSDDYAYGIFKTSCKIHFKENALGTVPRINQRFEIDGEEYIITQSKSEFGLVTLTLEREDE